MTPLFGWILAYCALLVLVGLRAGRTVRSGRDFFVAGRSLSSGLLFSTFLAANLGAGATVGVAELGYLYGLSAWWWVGSAGIGSLALAFWVGPRLYRIAAQHNLYTVGDYLELRYNRAARLATASLLWLGSLAILAGQLIAIGVVLHVVAGVSASVGSALGGLIVVVYFSAGGLASSARVNVVQLVVKAVGFAAAIPWALSAAGGWDGIAQAAAVRGDAEAFMSITGVGAAGVARWAVILIPSFLVSPGLLQKLYGARDETVVRRGVGLQGVCLLGYSFLPVLLGMCAFALLPDLERPALALPTLLAEKLPSSLGGLMLAAIFSAEISSADAILFMLSTAATRDLAPSLIGRQLDENELLRWARVAAVFAGLLGVLAALWLDSIVAALTIFYSLLTVTLFVPLLAGLFWKRPRSGAALAAMAAGAPMTIAVQAATDGAGWGILNPAAAGLLVSAVFFILFATRKDEAAPL